MSEEIVQRLTKLSMEQQSYLCRMYSKFNTQTRVQIEDTKRPIFHKLRSVNQDINNSTLSLAAWFMALESFMKKTDTIKLKLVKEGSKRSRMQKKREKLLSYWAIVKTLRVDEQMSFREMSQYFFKYHKFEVSYSTIHGLWTELESNITEEN